MKTLLVAVNSRYSHSNLAVWYLKAACNEECGKVKVLEFSINDLTDSVIKKIYAEKPDNIAFSCYIWNIEMIARIVDILRNILPNTIYVFGGPEVSYENLNPVLAIKEGDIVIKGEGEEAFPRVLRSLYFKETPEVIQHYNIIECLDDIKTPYSDEMLQFTSNKTLYYESSRGCPFNCSYCISSTFKGVRTFSDERVSLDIKRLVDAGVKQIKFVDRTFNYSKKRAKKIWEYILSIKTQNTSFHFEISAELLDEDLLLFLKTVPKGLFKFEVGIQSTNKDVLDAVNRNFDKEKLFFNIKELISYNNIHVHLDLIAGLPLEDMDSFKKSFNDVYMLSPHHLQLGFLKLLYGTKIRDEINEHGYVIRPYPPYEILMNRYLTTDEYLIIKDIEECIERYFNSKLFLNSIRYLVGFFDTPFELFYDLSFYLNQGLFFERSHSQEEYFRALYDFATKRLDEKELYIFTEILRFDFLSQVQTNRIAEFLYNETKENLKERVFEFLKNEDNINEYLFHYTELAPKEIYKRITVEPFFVNPYNFSFEMKYILFDKSIRDSMTGHCYSCVINI